ncbi:MAG: hypothetical protein CL946_07585 [Ectothiorhodospiraceae bacterium]|nr:hypothetical protein [Ectothiorhodospiraceae bacterium]
MKRINLDDRSRAVVGGTVDFIGEEELFDDPYSYESDEATLKITQVINERMTLKVAGFGMVKGYSYPSDLSLLDLPGVPLREDRRFGGWAMLTYQVPGSWLLFSGLDVGVSYVYTRNESNTNWYDYSANDISIQVGTDF